ETAAIAKAVAVSHGASQHVRDCLDAAMRVPRKSGEIVARIVIAKVVEQQERIEFGRVAKSERALELDAGAFERRLRMQNVFHWTDRHRCSPRESEAGLKARTTVVEAGPKACTTVVDVGL